MAGTVYHKKIIPTLVQLGRLQLEVADYGPEQRIHADFTIRKYQHWNHFQISLNVKDPRLEPGHELYDGSLTIVDLVVEDLLYLIDRYYNYIYMNSASGAPLEVQKFAKRLWEDYLPLMQDMSDR